MGIKKRETKRLRPSRYRQAPSPQIKMAQAVDVSVLFYYVCTYKNWRF